MWALIVFILPTMHLQLIEFDVINRFYSLIEKLTPVDFFFLV